MQDQQRWDQLEAAVRDVVESQQGESTGRRKPARRSPQPARPLILLLLLVWSMIGWIWSTRPAFLFGRRITVERTPAQEEATLRFALYLERGRVDAYVRRNGQLPARLSDAGPQEEGVMLVPTSDGYELVGQRRDMVLRLSNRMSPDSFLGNSLDQLQREDGTPALRTGPQ